MADTEPMDAEAYLRSKFGAYRGHPEWRALEAAFNAGRATPPSPSTAPEVGERAAFESWAVTAGPWDGPLQWGRLSNGEYKHTGIEGDWKVWQARAALASRPADPSLKPAHEREYAESSKRAEVDDEGLPALPDGHAMEGYFGENGEWATVDGYTAEQYRQGQRDAVAADRARREKEQGMVEVKPCWGHFDSRGNWFPNPRLQLSADQQFAENVVNGYIDNETGKLSAPSHTTNKEK